MFDNLKNLGSMMGHLRDLSEKADQLQAELAAMTVEGDAGAGAVRVVANGKMEVLSVRLDAPLLAAFTGGGGDDDRAMMEELIAGAVNSALEKARQLIKEQVREMAGGLDVPGLDKLLGAG